MIETLSNPLCFDKIKSDLFDAKMMIERKEKQNEETHFKIVIHVGCYGFSAFFFHGCNGSRCSEDNQAADWPVERK